MPSHLTTCRSTAELLLALVLHFVRTIYMDVCSTLSAATAMQKLVCFKAHTTAGDVEESIKSGGLAAIKTERIKVCLISYYTRKYCA